MMRRLWMFMIVMLFLGGISVHAEDMKPSEYQARTIPYKSDNTPLDEHGSRIGWVLIAFLLVAWAVSSYLRKKGTLGSLYLLKRHNPQLHVLDRHRLDARMTLYVVEFDQKKLLIGHAGDTITTLAESEAFQKNADQDA